MKKIIKMSFFSKVRRLMANSMFLLAVVSAPGIALATPAQVHPVGMPSVLDLGATSCIPCKMMAPILEELRTEYQGKAAVIFVDVWKNKDPGHYYKIRAIPTQIFFNRKGEEVARHEGFMDKKSIATMLNKLLEEK